MGCGASSSLSAQRPPKTAVFVGEVSTETLQLGSSFRTSRRGGVKKQYTQTPTVWVGHIPTSHASDDALRKLFDRFGTVASVNVRYKPDQPNVADKSWAFVTLGSVDEALHACDAEVSVVSPESLDSKVLTVQPADVKGERKRRTAGEDERETAERLAKEAKQEKRRALLSPSERRLEREQQVRKMGAREKLWQQEQTRQAQSSEAAAAEAAAASQKEAALNAKLLVAWDCPVCSRSNPSKVSRCGACKGARPMNDDHAVAVAARRRRSQASNDEGDNGRAKHDAAPEQAAEDPYAKYIVTCSGAAGPTSSPPPTAVHADSFTARQVSIQSGATSAHQELSAPWCTIWVGGIPASFLRGVHIDVARRKLKQLFDEHGQVLSVTIRTKQVGTGSGSGKRGEHASWALITYDNALSVKRATEAGAVVRVRSGHGSGGVSSGGGPSSNKPIRRRSSASSSNNDGGERVEVALHVKPAELGQQLAKQETGALAGVWKQQAAAIQAAIKIQASVRSHSARKRERKKKGRR